MTDAPEVKEGIFSFDPDDPIYRDHFPGYPVVPGSLVVQAFLDLAGDTGEIDQFRFRSFLVPGAYRYRMVRVQNGWECLLLEGEKTMVKGRLIGR
jgi:3-hydroxyacyl-[acyl-carrier-protein] dehydratase